MHFESLAALVFQYHLRQVEKEEYRRSMFVYPSNQG